MNTATPGLDAQVLLAHILNKPRSWVLAHPEVKLTEDQTQRLAKAHARLAAGEPLPYILGHWEFYGLDFQVSPAVLIPRPETELLVEQALAWTKENPTARLALDVGTGSGCIAISMAVHSSALHILAIDCSWAALKIAQANARKYGVGDRIAFIQADLLNPIVFQEDRCDLLMANLPYIPTETLVTLEVFGKEPELALNGGLDGLALIRRLLLQTASGISTNGLALFEIENRQGAQAQTMAQATFPSGEITILKDLAGHDRLLRIKPRRV